MGLALRPYAEGKVPDVQLFPVTISYEERMETHLYAREMLGTPKPKESFMATLKATSILKHNHGRMHVRIAPAISTHTAIGSRIDRAGRALTPAQVPYSTGEKEAILDLGYEVVMAHQDSFIASVPSLLATVVLAEAWESGGRREMKTATLVRDTAEIAVAVQERGQDVDLQPTIGGRAPEPMSPAQAVEQNFRRFLGPLSPALSLRAAAGSVNCDIGPGADPFNSESPA